MESTALVIWSETVPNWLMALSAVSAAVLFFWRKQDRREAFAAREAGIRDGVNAVWVTAQIDSDPKARWGILVTNQLSVPITQLHLDCHGNLNSASLEHPSVQPGRHFFESLPQGSARPWALPSSNVAHVEYVSVSRRHAVHELTFSHAGRSYTRRCETVEQSTRSN
ncbi:hypothetical protein [Leucobacter sp. PH1c]|uniref:hypothetical protein n=1 Tax=Leucobacter sp. PH1c TaxID=1397278 RepID=UPI0012FF4C81|nr:hypothetical protein [Leucobacter sp. PH1c]